MDQNEEDNTRVNLTFEVTPQKAKLFREKIPLVDVANKDNKCVVTLHCRVLGKYLSHYQYH